MSLVLGRKQQAPPGRAWLSKGFRPFFLLAALHGFLAVPIWLLTWSGFMPLSMLTMPVNWHAHEMVFGFAGAAIAGFLLTAVSNWTGHPTVIGIPLGLLAALWIVGRVMPFVGGQFGGLGAAAADASFFAGLMFACARPILRARDRRNYGFIVLLLALFLASAQSHAERLGVGASLVRHGVLVGVDLVVLVILTITGRVVPSFTRNATGQAGIVSRPTLDRVLVVAMALLVFADIWALPRVPSAWFSVLVGLLALARAWGWGFRYTRAHPLLWVLHLGHAWVALGLILRGAALYLPGFASAGLHAITAGGIGSLVLGMMTRVSLGHTGRMLAVGRTMAWAFAALSGSALLRVFGPQCMPAHAVSALVVASGLWSFAFAAFLLVQGPVLLAPRVDGRA